MPEVVWMQNHFARLGSINGGHPAFPPAIRVIVVVRLPVPLVAVATRFRGPDGTFTRQDQPPPTAAVVVHRRMFPARLSTTVAPGVAVPLTVKAVASIAPAAGDRMLMVGASDTVKLVEAVAVTPASSATAVIWAGPTGNVTGHDHPPPELAVVVQRVVLPGPVSTTVAPGVAVPDTSVVVAVVTATGAVIEMLNGHGARPTS